MGGFDGPFHSEVPWIITRHGLDAVLFCPGFGRDSSVGSQWSTPPRRLAGLATGHGPTQHGSGHKPKLAMLAAAALLHAQAVSISSSGRPSELAECLEKLVLAHVKKMSGANKI